jgi:DNA repair protein RecN (Recombination protein N)
MLRRLYIRNFAVVEELDVEFDRGFCVLSGETGAGKSIVVDAVALILGDRSDAAIIRGDEAQAELVAEFDISDEPRAAALLLSRELPLENGETLIRRVINRDGRSRAFLNGSPVPVQILKELGELLVDIHGQHAHQSLFRRDIQRALLDEYGAYPAAIEAVRSACEEWQEVSGRLSAMSRSGADFDAELRLLRYQVEELDGAAPGSGEFEALEVELKRLANAGRLLETVQRTLQAIDDDELSATARLAAAVRDLRDMQHFDPRLAEPAELIDSASIQAREAADALHACVERLDLDPRRLQEVEQRLDALHALARKHHVRPQELPDHAQSLRQRLSDLEQGSSLADGLRQRQEAAMNRYREDSERLHRLRIDAAARLSERVSAEMQRLGMPHGRFSIEVDVSGTDRPAPHGGDQVQFLVGVNPGQPALPLSRVASGGELSRISLAIQMIGSSGSGVPTLIFDEVDAGIGGAIAEIVGVLLRRIADRRQVICVTHLPQVAAQGEHHFLVEKETTKKQTRTRVGKLDENGRIEEIARMLGGLKISDRTRASAREMLEQGEREKGKGKR